MPTYIGIDYGGTQTRLAPVDPDSGAIGDLVSLPSQDFATNAELLEAISAHIPVGAAVGISAAGVVDEVRLVIDYAPNAPISGPITFAAELAGRGHRVTICNDMRAAAQGEASFGYGRDGGSIAVATYSTGFNCAVAQNGRLLPLAPEAGHFIYRGGVPVTCGCGCEDHLEPYVSGTGAALMAQRWFAEHPDDEHPIVRAAGGVERITAAEVYVAYRGAPDQEPQCHIRDEQVRAIATSLTAIYSLYHPLSWLVLMGSQTKDWDVLFAPAIAMTRAHRYPGHHLPEIVPSRLPAIGLQGAVAYLLLQQSA